MIIGDLATYLTDGGQVLSAIFEARIREKGVKVGQMVAKTFVKTSLWETLAGLAPLTASKAKGLSK